MRVKSALSLYPFYNATASHADLASSVKAIAGGIKGHIAFAEQDA